MGKLSSKKNSGGKSFLYFYLYQLLLKSRLSEATSPYPFGGKADLKTRPQIVEVDVYLRSLVDNLLLLDDIQVMAFFDKISEQAFLQGAQEIRLDGFAKLGPRFPKDVCGGFSIVFFGEEKAKLMLTWLRKKENLALLGNDPHILFDEFETSAQYEFEARRLATPTA